MPEIEVMIPKTEHEAQLRQLGEVIEALQEEVRQQQQANRLSIESMGQTSAELAKAEQANTRLAAQVAMAESRVDTLVAIIADQAKALASGKGGK